jgi:hypothetical protein
MKGKFRHCSNNIKGMKLSTLPVPFLQQSEEVPRARSAAVRQKNTHPEGEGRGFIVEQVGFGRVFWQVGFY